MKKSTAKRIRTVIAFIMAAALVFAAIPYRTIEYQVNAIDTSEANEQALKDKIAAYQAEEEEYKKKIDAAKAESKSQAEYKEELDHEVTATQSEIITTEALIAEYSGKIDTKKSEIKVLEKKISDKYSIMLDRLRFTYEEGDASYLEMILNADSFTDFLMTVERVGSLMDYDRSLMSELQTNMKALENDKAILEETKASQEEAKSNLSEKKVQLQNQVAEVDAYIAQLQSDAAAMEEAEAKVAAAQVELDGELSALLAQRAKEEAAKRAAASGGSYSYGTGGSVYGDYSTNDNPVNPGLSWPVPGYSTISSGYGSRWGTTHLGIDIPAPMNTPVCAAAAGTVIIAKSHSSYGNYVVIDHGNGFCTLYAHNTYLAVSAGDTVSAGQVIAGVGTTGSSTGYHSHFEVRINGSTVNPENFV